MKYKNVGGEHICKDGTVVPNGKFFDSDDKDLCKKFPNKFEAVNDQVTDSVNKPAPVNNDPVDVTEDYPEAKENKMTVTKIGKGWWVTEEDEDEAAHDKPLKKKDVEAFIKELLED